MGRGCDVNLGRIEIIPVRSTPFSAIVCCSDPVAIPEERRVRGRISAVGGGEPFFIKVARGQVS